MSFFKVLSSLGSRSLRKMLKPGLAALTMAVALTHAQAQAPINVLTHHYDNARTGQNPNETVLNTSNVNGAQFGKLFSLPVDGNVYAQPLYVANLAIPGKGTHNVLFVATMHDSVYAFDADSTSGANVAPLWKTSLINAAAGVIPVPLTGNISPEQGITGTPVIDLTTKTIYFVTVTKETVGVVNSFPQRLHALDITTGAEKFGGPVTLAASVPGTGTGSVNGIVAYSAVLENQRPALLLSNGVVYVAVASHGDRGNYHGWVLAYDAANLHLISAFNDTPNGAQGGIWMSGAGPAADAAGNIYVVTGNGTFSPDDPNAPGNYGNSILKLTLNNGQLGVLDYFAPFNMDYLNADDQDLGCAGVMVLPGTSEVVGGGKQGVIYLVNTANMGHQQPASDSQIVQSFQATFGPSERHHIHGQPVYWNGPNGPAIFVWGENDSLRGYALTNGLFQTLPFAQSVNIAPPGMPGGMLTLSSKGAAPGTGIVWAEIPIADDALGAVVPGVLRAFDAGNLNELWNSEQQPVRDSFGNFAKFCPPVIVNGKVYMATFSGQVVVYGLLSPRPNAPTNLRASAGASQITLTWYSSPGATSYTIYRGLASGQETATPVGRNLTTTTFSDTQAAPGVPYFYKVTGVNALGEGSASAEASAYVSFNTPENFKATSHPGSITLSWSSVPNTKDYHLYRATSPGGEGAVSYVTGLTTSSFTDTNVIPNTSYYYTVSAVSQSNIQSPHSNEVNAAPSLTAPSNVTATAGHKRVTLNWSTAPGASSYNVYRAWYSGGEGWYPYQTNINSPTYTDQNVGHQTYYYQITAVVNGQESPLSQEVSASGGDH